MRFTLIFIFLTLLSSASAQKTGRIDYPAIGLSFTIPEGWVGQEGDGVFMMGSNSLPGVVLISTSDAHSLESIRQEALAGVVDQAAGINLQLSSTLEDLGKQSIGGEFSGVLENQSAKAYIIGMNNPYGQSLIIMAATLSNLYNNQYVNVARQIFKSITFSKPIIPPVVNQWKKRLAGTRLTYMESYSSYDYSNPNFTSGGSYAQKEQIDLCPEGYFNYNEQFNMSVGAPGASGMARDGGRGAGKWKVIPNAQGNAVLQLSFHTGEIYEYVLSFEEDKTFLNGTRYFRTSTGENAPVCY